jgi:pilus assembly protein CpaE
MTPSSSHRQAVDGGPLRVLLVADGEAARRLAPAISARRDMEVVGTASDLEEALRQVDFFTPDVVLVDEALSKGGPLPVVRQICAHLPHLVVVVIASPDSLAYAQQAVLAGARAFVMRPFTEADLVQTLQQAFAVEHSRRSVLARALSGDGRAHEPGQVITLTSLKGGVGATFLAVNLAIALRRQTGLSVALVEGPPGGDMAVLLNLRPTYTLLDLVPQIGGLDAELLAGVLAAHQSGVRVLPYRLPSVPFAVEPEAVFSVVRQLQNIYDFVVVEAGRLWGRDWGALLQMTDSAYVLTTPEMPALRRAAVLYEQAQMMGFPTNRLRLVVNRATAEGAFPAKDIAERLRIPNLISVPADRAAAVYAVNRGIPLVLSQERHPIARSIAALAKEMGALRTQGAADGKAGRGLKGLLRPRPVVSAQTS